MAQFRKTIHYEPFKQVLGATLNDYVFFLAEVYNIIQRFSLEKQCMDILRKELSDRVISLATTGVNPAQYGLHSKVALYKGSDVWTYLKNRETKKLANLQGITGIEMIVERGYHYQPKIDNAYLERMGCRRV